jgi:hypothetical protein
MANAGWSDSLSATIFVMKRLAIGSGSGCEFAPRIGRFNC